MKSDIWKLLINMKKPVNINIVPFLKVKCFPHKSPNVTNPQRSYSKLVKSDYFIVNNKINQSSEKISLGAYSLLAVPIGAFMLGTWQIQRHQWKLDLIDKLNSRTDQEPIDLLAHLQDIESKEYYPVKVKGKFLYDKEFIVGHRGLIMNGKSVDSSDVIKKTKTQGGYHVITPFKVSDQDLIILVNRGWIPRSHKHPIHRKRTQIIDETEIVGILRLHERRPPFVPKNNIKGDIWYYRDVNAMAEKAGTSPIYIEMVSDHSEEQFPIAGQTKVDLRNEHLSYILTWYCLSAATAFIWYKKFVKGIPFVY